MEACWRANIEHSVSDQTILIIECDAAVRLGGVINLLTGLLHAENLLPGSNCKVPSLLYLYSKLCRSNFECTHTSCTPCPLGLVMVIFWPQIKSSNSAPMHGAICPGCLTGSTSVHRTATSTLETETQPCALPYVHGHQHSQASVCRHYRLVQELRTYEIEMMKSTKLLNDWVLRAATVRTGLDACLAKTWTTLDDVPQGQEPCMVVALRPSLAIKSRCTSESSGHPCRCAGPRDALVYAWQGAPPQILLSMHPAWLGGERPVHTLI